jgi:para-nitrobenzyl esterase
MSLVETSLGRLAGSMDGGALCFRGIPYAAPPTGQGRFRAPRPMTPWSGVRSAEAFGPAAMQLPTQFSRVPRFSEDCLYLNVWTPSLSGKRPVMVFVHGGAYIFGAGHEPGYDGRPLAEYGDVVIVTLNYRLSALGFAYLQQALPGRDLAANPALLDVIAALRWVQAEIAAFGGDPRRVTVFGESAGGSCVSALLSMRSARGLFGGAICQSGGPYVSTPSAAAAIAREYLAVLQVDPAQPDRLWQLPAEALIRATTELKMHAEFGVGGGERFFRSGFRFGLVADGGALPEDPLAAIRAGENPVPLMVGTNQHEWRFFSHLVSGADPREDAVMRRRLSDAFGERAAGLIATYSELPDLLGTTLADVVDAITTDLVFRMPAICLAQAHAAHSPAFMYLLQHRSKPFDGGLGACHGIDLPLVFRTLHEPVGQFMVGDGPEALKLSDLMSSAWLAFARTGNPQCAGLPDWPGYSAGQRCTMLLSEHCSVVCDPMHAQRRAWDVIDAFGVAARG